MDSSTKTLDRELALARVGGDEELLREIAVLFLDNYEQWLAELNRAAASGNALAVEHAAHGLKGSVANFGAQSAVDAALEIEHLGRNRDLAGIAAAIATLELALALLRPELESL